MYKQECCFIMYNSNECIDSPLMIYIGSLNQYTDSYQYPAALNLKQIILH